MRCSCSASGSDKAPAGIGAAPSVNSMHAGVRVAVIIGADRADDDRRRRRLLAGEASGRGCAGRRTCHSSSRPGFAGMAWRRTRSCRAPPRSGAASNSGDAVEADDFGVMPCGGVAPLLPSALITRGCGKGERISAFSSPRTQTGMSKCLDPDIGEAHAHTAWPPPRRGRGLRPRCRPAAARPRSSGLRRCPRHNRPRARRRAARRPWDRPAARKPGRVAGQGRRRAAGRRDRCFMRACLASPVHAVIALFDERFKAAASARLRAARTGRCASGNFDCGRP